MTVDGNLIAKIGKGVLAFAAIGKDDTMDDTLKSASRLLKMKLWEDEAGAKVSLTSDDIDSAQILRPQFSGRKVSKTLEEKSFVVNMTFSLKHLH